MSDSFFWLGYPDSNQERQDQNLQCYHYTIPQTCGAFLKMRVQRYSFFWNLQKKTQVFYKKTQIFMESVLFWGYLVYLCSSKHTYLYLMEQTLQLVDTITKGIQEKKGQRIVVANLRASKVLLVTISSFVRAIRLRKWRLSPSLSATWPASSWARSRRQW